MLALEFVSFSSIYMSSCLSYSSSNPKSKGLSRLFFCRLNSVVQLAEDKIRKKFHWGGKESFLPSFPLPHQPQQISRFSFVSKPSCLVPLTSSFPTGRIIWVPRAYGTQLSEPASSPTEPVSVVRARKSALQTSQVVFDVQPGLAANCSKSSLIISYNQPHTQCLQKVFSLCHVLKVTISRFIQK